MDSIINTVRIRHITFFILLFPFFLFSFFLAQFTKAHCPAIISKGFIFGVKC